MQLETERLLVVPLNYEQLLAYLEANTRLEEELNLARVQRAVSKEVADAMNETILPAVADASENYVFLTLWTIISKRDNQMVGDFCFKGKPDTNGEIEIGYGIYDNFRRKGYMTEAISAIAEWAFSQAGVKAIMAETEQANFASHKALQNNGFRRNRTAGDMIWWKLTNQSEACYEAKDDL